MNESFMRKITVMVVDSDGEFGSGMDGVLARRVKTVHYFKDSADALRNFSQLMPQLVILNLRLAIMDIVDFSSKIKSMNAECEIIVVLGFIEPHRLVEMINLGIYRFILKPLTPSKLSDAVSKSVDTLMEKALSYQSKYMQEILNAEDNPVFETDGVEIFKANKAFMECFGVKNLKQFGQAHPDLSSVFVTLEGEGLNKNWLRDYILGSDEPKAEIYDNRKAQKREFFLELGISESARGRYVVSMTDITEVEQAFSRKIEMLSSQIASKEKIKFRSMLEFEISRCKRYKKTFSLVLMSFSIEEAENLEVWERIFKVVRRALRSSDLFAKVDKNQLAVIATETQKDGAVMLVERLKKELAGHDISSGGGAVEYGAEDSVQTLLKKALSCL